MSVTHDEGDLIGGRYRLLAFLGEGGVAKAWRGRDEQTGEPVVVKHPNFDSENDPGVIRDSIQREGEVLGSIQSAGGHPNLMGLVETTTTQGHPALVVEHVGGENLYDEVKRRNGFTNAEDVRQVGIALCEAMSFLHRNEIMYRDLKPDNVMLRPDGTPVLIDFNTAKGFVPEQGEESRSGTVIPNPTYKPPELNNDPELVGYRQGPWSDVYSIGKVLMFMFAASAARGDGVDPREFPGTRSVPAYLAESIQRATQSHKDDRYRNATVFAQILSRRSSAPPAVASVVHLQTGERHEVYPGDTIGREAPDGPQPSISLDDPESHISAVQVQFEADGDTWRLRDRSLNGTWLERDGEWHRILSATGRERLRERADEPDPRLDDYPEQAVLRDGDRVALVHPSYDVWLQFEQ